MEGCRVLNQEPFENLDRLLQVEFRPAGLPRGYIPKLYQLARGERPLTEVAADALLGVAERERIAVVTGVVFDGLPAGEIDGPIGAVVLANALSALGRRPEVLVEAPLVPVVEALRHRIGGDFVIVDTSEATPAEVEAWADEYAAAVAIEKLGKNRAGVRHSISGTPLPPEEPALDDLFTAMLEKGKPTIGMGDGGNEIGFGAIYEHVRELIPEATQCECSCGDGMATTTATEVVMPVNVSNFGAYAIVAALAMKTDKPSLLPSGSTVIDLIQVAVRLGCLDGGTVLPGAVADDGIPGIGVSAFVELLRTIVGQSFVTLDRHF